MHQKTNRCVFLVNDDSENIATCSVYPFRPEACRNWVPSLSHYECQEGLRRLAKSNEILLPNEIYQSEDKLRELYSIVSENIKIYNNSDFLA